MYSTSIMTLGVLCVGVAAWGGYRVWKNREEERHKTQRQAAPSTMGLAAAAPEPSPAPATNLVPWILTGVFGLILLSFGVWWKFFSVPEAAAVPTAASTQVGTETLAAAVPTAASTQVGTETLVSAAPAKVIATGEKGAIIYASNKNDVPVNAIPIAPLAPPVTQTSLAHVRKGDTKTATTAQKEALAAEQARTDEQKQLIAKVTGRRAYVQGSDSPGPVGQADPLS
jgi:hypothetical protein